MAFGVTSEGFTAKTVEEIVEELNDAFRAAFGDEIDVSPESNFGQVIGVMAERYADLWGTAEAIYNAFTPDGALGTALDNVAAITGTVREPARTSEVTLTATGTPTTALTAGRIASVETAGTRFVTLDAGTITLATSWIAATAYTAGAIRTNSSRIYLCTTGGTSAGSGGPTTTAEAITDGTAVWRYLGEGTGYAEIAAESEETGPKQGASGTINVIETPVAGWSSVINVLDAELGADVETDPALRLRREEEVRGSGRAALESIRAALLQLDDVTSVTVFENVSDTTNGDGMPPHSVEALVQGGDDAEIAETLWENTAAGIATHGTESETVTDSQGIDHTVEFSRPDELTIYVRLDLVVDPDEYPSDGDTLVKQAVVDWGDAQRTGKNVVSSAIAAQAFNVPGVLEVTLAYIRTSSPPIAATTIAVSLREIAVYDTSRVTVNTTPGVP